MSFSKPARNLLHELSERGDSGCYGGPSKRSKSAFDDVKHKVMSIEGGPHDRYSQAWCLEVSDDYIEKALSNGNRELLGTLSKIPGTYWKVAEYSGMPVFKQEACYHPPTQHPLQTHTHQTFCLGGG